MRRVLSYIGFGVSLMALTGNKQHHVLRGTGCRPMEWSPPTNDYLERLTVKPIFPWIPGAYDARAALWALAASAANRPLKAHFRPRRPSRTRMPASASSTGSPPGHRDPLTAIAKLHRKPEHGHAKPKSDRAGQLRAAAKTAEAVPGRRFRAHPRTPDPGNCGDPRNRVRGCAETESEAVEKLSALDCDAIVLDINLLREADSRC